MNDFVYALDIPPLTDFISNIDQYKIKGPGVKMYPIDILEKEYQTWNDIPWDYVAIFYKANGFRPPVAHVDAENRNCWGINFHIDGSGLFELYRFEDVTRHKEVSYATDYIINNDPVKSYYMPEGAYLVNNSLPHRITGYQERFCISLRASSLYDLPFEQILERFKNCITHKPLLSKPPM